MMDDSISLLTGDELTVMTDDADVASAASMGPKHEINLRFNRSSIKIEASGDDSFSDIKKEIEEKTGVPVHEQDLQYLGAGFKIRDDRSLNYYKIANGSFFTLKRKEKK